MGRVQPKPESFSRRHAGLLSPWNRQMSCTLVLSSRSASSLLGRLQVNRISGLGQVRVATSRRQTLPQLLLLCEEPLPTSQH